MKLEISPSIHEWFIKEMGANQGESIRIFGKYGGETMVHKGFSTGIEFAKPVNPSVELEIDGITYFIEESDDWFFGQYDLSIDTNEEQYGEPKYIYEPIKTSV